MENRDQAKSYMKILRAKGSPFDRFDAAPYGPLSNLGIYGPLAI